MGKKIDKLKIYELLDKYLAGYVNESTFCDEFYFSFDLATDKEILSEYERTTLAQLSNVASRFSQFKEDHLMDKLAFSSAEELRGEIIKAKEKLLYKSK